MAFSAIPSITAKTSCYRKMLNGTCQQNTKITYGMKMLTSNVQKEVHVFDGLRVKLF